MVNSRKNKIRKSRKSRKNNSIKNLKGGAYLNKPKNNIPSKYNYLPVNKIKDIKTTIQPIRSTIDPVILKKQLENVKK